MLVYMYMGFVARL